MPGNDTRFSDEELARFAELMSASSKASASQRRKGVARKVTRSISSFFDGEDGSVFWLIKQAIAWVKALVDSINELIKSRRSNDEDGVIDG